MSQLRAGEVKLREDVSSERMMVGGSAAVTAGTFISCTSSRD